MSVIGTCRLCLATDIELCHSHIIPKFFYAQLRRKGVRLRRFVKESGQGRYVQDGYKEHLLCGACEQHLNTNYEIPFKAFWKTHLASVPAIEFTATGLAYQPLKLCLLSILWRAHVASESTWGVVDLGPRHAETIRTMVRDNDAGPEGRYAPGVALLKVPGTTRPLGLVGSPNYGRINKRYIYKFYFGGCAWRIPVASHSDWSWARFGLRQNGDWLVQINDATQDDYIINGRTAIPDDEFWPAKGAFSRSSK